MPDQILRVTAMRQKLGGIARSTFHVIAKQPGFPSPVILTAGPNGLHGWRESEVDAWLASRPRVERAWCPGCLQGFTAGTGYEAGLTSDAQEYCSEDCCTRESERAQQRLIERT